MTSPKIDPLLLLSISEAINHDALADNMKPVTTAWVKKYLVKLLKEYYTSSIDWLAFTIARPSENDPLTKRERMSIFLICSEMLLVYRSDLTKLMPNMNLDDPLEMEKILNWSRAIMTMGFLLAREPLDESIPDKKES